MRWSLLFLLIACASQPATEAPPPPPAPPAAGAPPPQVEEKEALIQVVALSDFHGHLLPLEPKGFPRYYGGIANIAGMLEHKESLDPSKSIIIDNGDMWTGPTESTLLRGESVIQAYNVLGVAAANVANHEFDFGIEILRARAGEAKFPLLGANIVNAGTDQNPDFVKPYAILDRAGFKVGILGLSYIDTPKTTLAKHVAGLEFKPYGETLQKFLPKMKADGAEVLIVLFHDEIGTVESTMKQIGTSGIHAVVAGQNHRKGQTKVEAVPIVNPGPFGRSYVRFDVRIDRATRTVKSVDHDIVDVTGEVGAPPFAPNPEIVAIAESARQKAKSLSSEVLGRVKKPLPVGTFGDSPLGHFIVDSWLESLPSTQMAILNHGAIRQPLGTGQVTMGDLMSVLPFENNLYVVSLTGKQIKDQLAIDGPVVGGVTWSYRELQGGARKVVSLVDRVGKPIKDTEKYKVIILDFMYTGGDGYTFKDLDTSPEDTGVSWREPIMRKLRTAEATSRILEPPAGARARTVK
jgi:2',3'-cyclic-nucleotide 2'-phosphodiesterase (5'-nucleotidase family)